jgi:glycyl-tRNA synthetase beta chain
MQPVEVKDHPELAEDLYDYITERLRNYYQSQDGLERNDIFEAVLSRTPRSALDFNHRMLAVAEFVKDEAAEQLAAANKRIANILRSGGVDAGAVLNPAILEADAEKALHQAMVAMHERIAPAIETRDYQQVLAALSELRAPVDQFFDDVMVMDEDVSKRRNRMALLSEVRGLFLEVADISALVSSAS